MLRCQINSESALFSLPVAPSRHVPHCRHAAERHPRQAVDWKVPASTKDHLADEAQHADTSGARGRERVLDQPALHDQRARAGPRCRAASAELAQYQSSKLCQVPWTQIHHRPPESPERHQDMVKLMWRRTRRDWLGNLAVTRGVYEANFPRGREHEAGLHRHNMKWKNQLTCCVVLPQQLKSPSLWAAAIAAALLLLSIKSAWIGIWAIDPFFISIIETLPKHVVGGFNRPQMLTSLK